MDITHLWSRSILSTVGIWPDWTPSSLCLENTVLLVALLYKMCKVELVLKSDTPDGINRINRTALAESTKDAQALMMDDRFVA